MVQTQERLMPPIFLQAVKVPVGSIAFLTMRGAGASGAAGQREMRSEGMFFLRNAKSLQRLVNRFRQRRKLRSGFNSQPEDASRFRRGENP